jgi:hypothetical protein
VQSIVARQDNWGCVSFLDQFRWVIRSLSINLTPNAIAALKSHVPPANYKKLRCSPAIKTVVKSLALDPIAQARFKASPAKFASTLSGLRPVELAAIVSARPYAIVSAMKATSGDVATQFVLAVIRSPTLAAQWGSENKSVNGNINGNDILIHWLKSKGYDTTIHDVDAAFEAACDHLLEFYDLSYTTQIDGQSGPTIVIRKGVVTAGGKKINKSSFVQSLLTWSASDGNGSSASLTFVVYTEQTGNPLPSNAYLGPQFYGTYWTGADKASQANAFGRIGPIPPNIKGPSTEGSKIDQFSDTYVTYILGAKDSTFVIEGTKVTYDGQVQTYTWSNNVLTATTKDKNKWNLILTFHVNTKSTSTNPTLGNQFSGKRWAAGDAVPSKANMFGQVGTSSNPARTEAALGTVTTLEFAGINLTAGVASMIASHFVIEGIKKLASWIESKSPIDRQAADAAIEGADEAAAQEEAIIEQAAEINPEGEVVDIISILVSHFS